MKILKTFLIILSLCALVAATPSVRPGDLSMLEGGRWTGTLKYRDYTGNRDYTIPVEVVVKRSTASPNSWIFLYEYPKEPHANNEKVIRLAENGRLFDGCTVMSKMKLADGSLRLVTEKAGDDNDKPAVFRYTYTIGRSNLSIRKDVRYSDAKEFFLRNEYKLIKPSLGSR